MQTSPPTTMARFLVLDTSTEWCSVALWRDGEILSRRELAEQRHSSLILPMVDGVLAEAGLKLGDLDGLAYGAGPGSFTGLRIACAVTQGLAFGADLPVVGVSTLESVAAQTGADRVLVALDARMAEVYWGAYRRDGEDWVCEAGPALALPEDVLAPEEAGWVGAGSGFAALADVLLPRLEPHLDRIDATLVPDAAAMAPLAARAFARGEGRDAAEAAPIYLRDKVALTVEERRLKRAGA